MLDLLIRGGEVVDGTGAPRYRADLGIAGGHIVEIGKIADSARRTIDADGRVISPGFIDVHTHYDAQAFWDPTLSPSPLHGVTTVLGGNCGFTIAPLSADAGDYLMRTLARVEGMPLATLQAGVPWDWKSTEDYLARLDGTLAPNAGFMVGHTALRRVVMGEDATKRTCTSDELEKMTALLREGLRAGAIGFSTSRGRFHHDANGDAVPSRHASLDEFLALARVCRDFPGTSLEFIPHHKPFSEEDLEIAIGMSVQAQRPLNWNLINPNAGDLEEDLAALEHYQAAAARGGKIIALAVPIDIRSRVSFATGFVLDAIPGWEKAMVLPAHEKLALLRNQSERNRLKDFAEKSEGLAAVVQWSTKCIAETSKPQLKHYEGRRVADIAAEEHKDPFDALVDIVCADDLQTTFWRSPRDTPEDWQARARIWRDNRTLIGASDAGAHVDLLDTFQFASCLLSSAVREHEIFTLEEAVEQLTSRPADLFGLRGRGRLVNGAKADIVIFDEHTVGAKATETRYDLPGGASRLYAEASGIDEVIVNGETIVAGGQFSDARPGTLLRAGKDTATPSLVG